jgi:hypothetical protein
MSQIQDESKLHSTYIKQTYSGLNETLGIYDPKSENMSQNEPL